MNKRLPTHTTKDIIKYLHDYFAETVVQPTLFGLSEARYPTGGGLFLGLQWGRFSLSATGVLSYLARIVDGIERRAAINHENA